MRRENWQAVMLFAALFLAIGFVLLCLMAASSRKARGDNRPSFELVFGESDQALEAWGRGWVGRQIRGRVWRAFCEGDRTAEIVVFACELDCGCEDEYRCALLALPNPGWRGRRADRAVVEVRTDGRLHLVQLRTFAR